QVKQVIQVNLLFGKSGEVLFGDLRSSIENSLAMTTSVNFTEFFSMLYFTGAPPPKDFSVHLAEYEGIEHTSQYNQRGWKEEEDCEDDDNDDGTGEQQYFEQ
ncbi:hypothetical protein PtrEW7m1_012187, partial [Pyrenophora tritici-repentis]